MFDPQRPRCHFLPPAQWMNDPNGVVQWQGYYHVFYQYNPDSPEWGLMHWGHTRSTDLVHWEHLPVALSPTPESVDADGCFSGVLVNDGGTPTIIYSGNHNDVQLPCLATSMDDLVTWEKYAGNPVIAGPPQGMALTCFRDHCVWREGDQWYQVIGAGVAGVGGAVLLYRSPDLRQWEYIHQLYAATDLGQGDLWECPDFFPLGNKYVLVISALPQRAVWYAIGTLHDWHFIPERWERLEASTTLYAPQTFRDDLDRRILFGWLCEERSTADQIGAGWSGVLSYPRILTLGEGDTLHCEPAPELTSLRGLHHSQSRYTVVAGEFTPILHSATSCLELLISWESDDTAIVGISLQHTTPTAHPPVVTIMTDGMTGVTTVTTPSGAWKLTAREKSSATPSLTWHLYIDCSVIEVFTDDGQSWSGRIYESESASSVAIIPFVERGRATITQADVWVLKPIQAEAELSISSAR